MVSMTVPVTIGSRGRTVENDLKLVNALVGTFLSPYPDEAGCRRRSNS